MNDKILSGIIYFPAGTIPGITVDMTIEIKFNSDDSVDNQLIVYQNGVLTYGDDSDW